MRESKLRGIAFELKNLWSYLTRQELCEYYSITDRTLYNYQNKLSLPRKINEQAKKGDRTISIYVKDNGKYKKQCFKSWEHFVVWEKAQSHSIKLDSINKDGKSYITCDFLQKRKEAKQYEDSLNL